MTVAGVTRCLEATMNNSAHPAPRNVGLFRWLAVEHYRIHVMELWPDGPRKEAGLAAARSTLWSLARTKPEGSSFTCMTCASRPQTVTSILAR
jgi:hypothetical protein